MKSKIFIVAISLVFLFAQKAYGGFDPCDSAYNYYTFRVCDDGEYYNDYWQDKTWKSDATLNCELWQKITSSKIPREDIYMVVYKMPYENILRISHLVNKSKGTDSLMNNQFVKWIVRNKDNEIIDFLCLAKLCEKARWELNSPWYYPTDGDDVSVTLEQVAQQAKSYQGNRLRDRYALQTIRALFATARYDDLINYWNDNKNIPNGLIKNMAMQYLAGAYYRTGNAERAKRIYAERGDIQSLAYCAQKEGKELKGIEHLELAYSYYPDSPAFEKEVQSIIRQYERERSRTDSMQCLRLYDFALKVIAEDKVTNRAMWYYTASFIADLKGNAQLASNFLSKAETARKSKFLNESIKVFRIYLDAKLYPYNAAYEQRLLGQLQWLDEKIRNNIDERVRQKTVDFYFRRNISYYYWNDMLRKIVFSEIAPRYAKQGNQVRAIQFVNMAENGLLNRLGQYKDDFYNISSDNWEGKTITIKEYRKSTSYFNRLDYSNDLSHLVDSVGVNNVIAYVQRLKRPRLELDHFLNERGYTNLDYFNEIIGTLCLREMRYADAVRYFAQVPASFQYTTNVYKENCMKRNPFTVDCFNSRISDNSDYKYNFAREMVSLERAIEQTTDPNRKAQLMIRYAIGMRNSSHDAWPLTRYADNHFDWNENIWKKNPQWEKADKLIKDALAMFTDDESAANYYWLLGRYKDVVSKYPKTQRAEYLLRHCDNLKDYVSK